MSLERNKAIVRRWIEAENKKDLASVSDLIAPDYVEPSFQLKGFEGAKQLMAMSYIDRFEKCTMEPEVLAFGASETLEVSRAS